MEGELWWEGLLRPHGWAGFQRSVTLTIAQQASKEWIEQSGTSDAPEAKALRQRIQALFERNQGTMN